MDSNSEGADSAGNFSSDPFTANCPGREIFNHVTSRWALLILASLSEGPMRFHILRDRVDGISEKMLSQTLKTLCRDGLVDRWVEPTVPPQVTYELTNLGVELAGHFAAVIHWMGRRVADILIAQSRHDDGPPERVKNRTPAASRTQAPPRR